MRRHTSKTGHSVADFRIDVSRLLFYFLFFFFSFCVCVRWGHVWRVQSSTALKQHVTGPGQWCANDTRHKFNSSVSYDAVPRTCRGSRSLTQFLRAARVGLRALTPIFGVRSHRHGKPPANVSLILNLSLIS